MNSELFDIIIPSVAFFVALFLIVDILELLLMIGIHKLFFTNRPPSSISPWIERFFLVFVILFVTAMLWFSRFVEIFLTSPLEIRVFALELILAFILIYRLTAQRLSPVPEEKRINLIFFGYISSILFVIAITGGSQLYQSYQKYINATLVYPVKDSINLVIENRRRSELLHDFRLQLLENDCPPVNFVTDEKEGKIDFFYVITDKGLRLSKKPVLPDSLFKGRLCTAQNTQFLVNDQGEWYWVIRDRMISSS